MDGLDLEALQALRLDSLFVHRKCVVVDEMLEKVIENNRLVCNSEPNLDVMSDDFFESLAPEHLGELKLELIGFARDLAKMDVDELNGVRILALREHRLSTIIIDEIEKRLML